MGEVLPLAGLGPRIMICGTSNTGKSTLAVAIGQKLGTPVVHLDQLRFQPNTDWQERPDEDFAALHDAAIAGEAWVMEGNYSSLWPQRLERTTGIIMLSDHRVANFARYLRRTLFEPHRLGNLAGNKDSIKWSMVHWVLVSAPRNVAYYRKRLSGLDVPFIECRSLGAQRRLYDAWDLPEPWRRAKPS